jgi:hypothetical protein
MSIRLVGLGAMSAPPRRHVRWGLVPVMLAGVVAWLPFVLAVLWLRGLL